MTMSADSPPSKSATDIIGDRPYGSGRTLPFTWS